uniref:Uncharacterized protein n=1 Tax=Glossina austeni TaxID=7395 RepID=A0A1A9UEU4_GLOAU
MKACSVSSSISGSRSTSESLSISSLSMDPGIPLALVVKNSHSSSTLKQLLGDVAVVDVAAGNDYNARYCRMFVAALDVAFSENSYFEFATVADVVIHLVQKQRHLPTN